MVDPFYAGQAALIVCAGILAPRADAGNSCALQYLTQTRAKRFIAVGAKRNKTRIGARRKDWRRRIRGMGQAPIPRIQDRQLPASSRLDVYFAFVWDFTKLAALTYPAIRLHPHPGGGWEGLDWSYSQSVAPCNSPLIVPGKSLRRLR